MSVYRVLVSFNAERVGDIVRDVDFWDVDRFVRAGYLKKIEEVQHVAGTGPEPGDVDTDLPVPGLPRKRRKTVKPEVTDVAGSAVPDAGPADGEEQGA